MPCPAETVCIQGNCHPICTQREDCRPGRYCNHFDGPIAHCTDPGPLDDRQACINQLSAVLDYVPTVNAVPDAEIVLRVNGAGMRALDGAFARVRKTPGQICSEHGDCATGLCIGGRCTTVCEELGECPEHMRCTILMNRLQCVGACRPDEDTCPEGQECAVSAEIGVAFATQCVASERATDVGQPCESNTDCRLGNTACISASDGRRCRTPCLEIAPEFCEVDEMCLPNDGLSGIGHCVPAGLGRAMELCTFDYECLSGECLESYAGGRCREACTQDEDCAAGVCIDVARDPSQPVRSCASLCEESCPVGLTCRRFEANLRACY